jgi:hypothetical protein
MKDAVGNVIIFDEVEDLGLVNVPGIGQGVKNPICINGKILPVTVNNPRFISSSDSLNTQGGIRGKLVLF